MYLVRMATKKIGCTILNSGQLTKYLASVNCSLPYLNYWPIGQINPIQHPFIMNGSLWQCVQYFPFLYFDLFQTQILVSKLIFPGRNIKFLSTSKTLQSKGMDDQVIIMETSHYNSMHTDVVAVECFSFQLYLNIEMDTSFLLCHFSSICLFVFLYIIIIIIIYVEFIST